MGGMRKTEGEKEEVGRGHGVWRPGGHDSSGRHVPKEGEADDFPGSGGNRAALPTCDRDRPPATMTAHLDWLLPCPRLSHISQKTKCLIKRRKRLASSWCGTENGIWRLKNGYRLPCVPPCAGHLRSQWPRWAATTLSANSCSADESEKKNSHDPNRTQHVARGELCKISRHWCQLRRVLWTWHGTLAARTLPE